MGSSQQFNAGRGMDGEKRIFANYNDALARKYVKKRTRKYRGRCDKLLWNARKRRLSFCDES